MTQLIISVDNEGNIEIHYMPNAPSFRGDRKWRSASIHTGLTPAIAEAIEQLELTDKIRDYFGWW